MLYRSRDNRIKRLLFLKGRRYSKSLDREIGIERLPALKYFALLRYRFNRAILGKGMSIRGGG